jgi:aspartate kinase
VSRRRVVMKFGGTSVADAEAILRLINTVRQQQASAGSPPVVVVSALAGVTDKLVAVARMAEEGDAQRAAAELHALSMRHVAVARAVTSESRDAVVVDIEREFEELIGIVHALAVLQEVSPRSLDAVLALGEVVSSRIVAAACADHRLASRWVDSRTVLVTDAEHNAAAPDMAATAERVRAHVAPVLEDGAVALLGGFIGATGAGITTTLGRGGSDYSAAIFGACLGVDEIQIWTDVDGMLTADPTILAGGHRVKSISFAEAAELAYFGAKVLHPATVVPAIEKNIPVLILNSRRPEVPGTRITSEAVPCRNVVKSIACKRRITLVNVHSTRMLMAYGFLNRIFEVFNRKETPVDMVATSEVSVSLTIDNPARLEEITAELRQFAEVEIESSQAIVCLVGENIRYTPGVARRVFNSLDRINIRMISQGASLLNISFVVAERDLPAAVAALHAEFFSELDSRVFERSEVVHA